MCQRCAEFRQQPLIDKSLLGLTDGPSEAICNYRVLDVDEETASYYATIRTELKRAGTPIPSNDVWIAALCRQHSFSLLSRDRHFDLVRGIERIDWSP